MTGATLSDPHRHSIPPAQTSAPARRRAARRTLMLLVLICVLPVAASYLAYYIWQPPGRMNYGELLAPPRPVPARSEFEGRWTLVYAGPAACPSSCADALYLMRQSRLAQGEEMNRVARVWLVTDGAPPAAESLRAQEGLRLAAMSSDEWLDVLPGATSGRHVYLVDPLGNAIMRFPENADPRKVVKDLQRLLKYSALGRG